MHTPDLDSLRKQISTSLADKKLTVADLARSLGKDYTQVYLWLSGRVTPNGEITIQLQKWLAAQ